ncbi:MAG: hypothetical protein GAK34_00684 [Delftia tsuruhatensis]|nr:MAG: hypothetical protein GAK34_00684 [Delftia tsuruhatensis]
MKPSTTASRTSSRRSVAVRVCASSFDPPPSRVTATDSGASSASNCSLAMRQRCTSWAKRAAGRRSPGGANCGSSRWASARSMLSPPSIRCSPTAVRVSTGRPPASAGCTRIRVRSVVPPPTSTTSTRRQCASSAARRSPCSTSQSWKAALGSSSNCTAGRPASRAASSVSARAPSSNEAGTVSTTSWSLSGAPGCVRSQACRTWSR